VRRQRAPADARELGLGGGAVLHQLGDAEVEQPHLAIGADEDVRRLQVAMDDEVLVGMLNRTQHLQHQRQPRRDRQPLAVAVDVQWRALDELEREVGLASALTPASSRRAISDAPARRGCGARARSVRAVRRRTGSDARA